MKLTSFFTTALAASAILFTACDKKDGAISEKDALARFEKEALAVKAEADAMKTTADPTNPMSMLPAVKKILDKMATMKTEGLPDDLKTALTEAQGKIATAKEMLKDVPDVTDLKALEAKMAADPALAAKLQKMGEEFPKVMDSVGPAMEKVEAAAKKHGINMK